MISPDAASDAARPPRKVASERLVPLDGLRLFAALSVLGFHFVSRGSQYWHLPGGAHPFPELHRVTAYGWMGVELFFIISGFVICMSSWGRGLGSFFVSRATRLYPAYWAGIVLTTVVLIVLPYPYKRLPVADLVANVTMFQAPLGAPDVDGSYWTLWREILFYLLFAIVVWRGVNYRRVVLFCVLWTTASVIAIPIENPALTMLVNQGYSMFFVAGVAMYLMRRFRPTLLLFGIVGFSLLLAIRAVKSRLAGFGSFAGAELSPTVAGGVVVLLFAIMLAVALGWFDWIKWRGLVPAGELTYPLYLIHGYAGFALINYFAPRTNRYALLAALVVGMLFTAWLIARLIERPMARTMRRGLTRALNDLRRESAGPSPVTPSPVEVPSVTLSLEPLSPVTLPPVVLPPVVLPPVAPPSGGAVASSGANVG